ncbi:MAG: 2,3-bisphosphoglycerate-independent phosphoglycerate mutase [Firmicutes bacterium]|nr:2,3-bisphosphoglycerate-independent phosphoglycerate mutase [Bacillota bacterium]
MIQGPVVLLILDGVADGARNAFDATFMAGMNHLGGLRRRYATTQLQAGGERVGLPDGQFGNSEVGHMNIGAGRVVWQELTRIDAAIRKGTFRENPAMAGLLAQLKETGKRLHLMGLVSPGGVHSHQDHLKALAQWAQAAGVPTTIHAFLDGRDTAQKSAEGFLAQLSEDLKACPLVKIGSLCGRYVVMDRDKRWERVVRAWKLMIEGEPEFRATDALAGIRAAYERGETDEFVSPTATADFQPIQDGDGVIFFNFRADRAREFSHALVNPAFDGFPRPHWPKVHLVTFTQYDTALEPYVQVAYAPQNLEHILGEVIADQGWKQLRTAETEKYAHVTFFFNGGREEPFKGEDRLLVPSPKVATYDLMPEMSCHEVTRGLLAAVAKGEHRFIVCNLANGDMVGHTGVLNAAIMACGVVDDAVRQIADAVLAVNGALIVTADHGNADCMRDEAGDPHTAHTSNPVPLVIVSKDFEGVQLRAGGALCDIAPTLLELMGLSQPSAMEGVSLLKLSGESAPAY